MFYVSGQQDMAPERSTKPHETGRKEIRFDLLRVSSWIGFVVVSTLIA